jgi:hypothetical protein
VVIKPYKELGKWPGAGRERCKERPEAATDGAKRSHAPVRTGALSCGVGLDR